MEENISIKLTREDNSELQVSAIPMTTDEVRNGAYDLFSEDINIGQIAFDLNDLGEWEYMSDVLTIEEVGRVAEAIQKHIRHGDLLK